MELSNFCYSFIQSFIIERGWVYSSFEHSPPNTSAENYEPKLIRIAQGSFFTSEVPLVIGGEGGSLTSNLLVRNKMFLSKTIFCFVSEI